MIDIARCFLNTTKKKKGPLSLCLSLNEGRAKRCDAIRSPLRYDYRKRDVNGKERRVFCT